MIRMRVRLDGPDEVDAPSRRRLQHRFDRVRRVDDGRYAGLLVADQVRRAAEIVVQELLEQHES
jgi:hypothetical protein